MIEVQKLYKITFTEQQARELYGLLQTQKNSGHLTVDHELILIHHELHDLFDTGIR